jgi:hypothetical protein
VQHWLAEEYALEVPYPTVPRLVRYGLGLRDASVETHPESFALALFPEQNIRAVHASTCAGTPDRGTPEQAKWAGD